MDKLTSETMNIEASDIRHSLSLSERLSQANSQSPIAISELSDAVVSMEEDFLHISLSVVAKDENYGQQLSDQNSSVTSLNCQWLA